MCMCMCMYIYIYIKFLFMYKGYQKSGFAKSQTLWQAAIKSRSPYKGFSYNSQHEFS